MQTDSLHSVGVALSPDGIEFPLPDREAIAGDFEAIRERARGRRVVVVQGLGFVGAAVAAVVADARDEQGEPLYFVIGVDRATSGSYWKIAKINQGQVPIGAPDAEFAQILSKAVCETGNLVATASDEAYALGEVILVDVHLDVLNVEADNPREISVDLDGIKGAIRAVGRRMQPDALVLVETTVPVGTCEKVLRPVLLEERGRRGITEPLRMAHAAERVMPGPKYIQSIRRGWRSFAGVDEASTLRAREFLESILDVQSFPLCTLRDPASSELGKLLENSYRAMNIAFIHEWTVVAEEAGIDLWSVIEGIRRRAGTHDNMRYPGFGVGGYCLTKDSLLAQWGLEKLLNCQGVLEMTLRGLAINRAMPLHTLKLIAELLDDRLDGVCVAVGGVAYLPGVADTRNAPTATLIDALEARGAIVRLHDPCVRRWVERPEIQVFDDVDAWLKDADLVAFCVGHREYQTLAEDGIVSTPRIVDACNIVDDEAAGRLHRFGARVSGVGKGHWRKLKYQTKA